MKGGWMEDVYERRLNGRHVLKETGWKGGVLRLDRWVVGLKL
jgi:hypothetical protein